MLNRRELSVLGRVRHVDRGKRGRGGTRRWYSNKTFQGPSALPSAHVIEGKGKGSQTEVEKETQ